MQPSRRWLRIWLATRAESRLCCVLLTGIQMEWAERTLESCTAAFGRQLAGPEHREAEIVLADPVDGSTKLTNANAAEKVVMIERGNVPFVEKVMNAQAAGAIAAVIFNHQAGKPYGMTDNGNHSLAAAITIPVVGISQADGRQLAVAIEAGRTTISLSSACYRSLFKFIFHVHDCRSNQSYLFPSTPLTADCISGRTPVRLDTTCQKFWHKCIQSDLGFVVIGMNLGLESKPRYF
eukprot:SAG11_NODE_2585_length_3194_cov_4.598061_3_plen_236_part_00